MSVESNGNPVQLGLERHQTVSGYSSPRPEKSPADRVECNSCTSDETEAAVLESTQWLP